MTKESTIALNNIDCNCNDCKFMQRDLVLYQKSLATHYKWQWDYFITLRSKLIEKARDAKYRLEDLDKHRLLIQEAWNMRFQFNRNEAKINYGLCHKWGKQVSFIPNTLQLDTQNCFINRRN